MVYTLMHKNIPVMDLSYNDITGGFDGIGHIMNAEHIPLGVRKTRDFLDVKYFNEWWKLRGIPVSREGIEQALELLKVADPGELMVKGFALSLSDHYWIKPSKSALDWDRINYYSHDFAGDIGDALFGKKPERENPVLMSPDAASNGNLRKKWSIVRGERVLIKSGSKPYYQEPLNEAIASLLLQRLGIDHTPYSLYFEEGRPYSACTNFTDANTEFVGAWDIGNAFKRSNEHSAKQHYISCCERMGIPGIEDSLDKMLAFDFLIVNSDRHYYNFGALRNSDTLEWLGPVPIFDCGNSLWFDVVDEMIDFSLNIKSKPFRDYHSEQIKVVKDLSWFEGNKLYRCDEECEAIFRQSGIISKIRGEKICYALKERIKMLEKMTIKHTASPWLNKKKSDDHDMGR